MLRDGAVELDQVDHGLRLPSEQIEEIRAMLAGDPRTALMGLEMAARCNGKVPPDEIAKALAKIPMPQARRILTQFATSGIEARRDVVEQLAEIGPQGIRRLAWEHIFCEGAATAARARPLLEDDDEAVRCVAAAAVLIDDPTDWMAQQWLTGGLSAASAIGALHVLRHATGRDVCATIAAIGRHSDPAVRAAALAAAENCAADSPTLGDWARQAISDPEPTVRQGALSLLVRSAPETELGEIAEKFLDDPWPEVRHAAAQALGARGETAVPAICGQLRRGSEDAQLAAIDALHRAIGPAAADRLFDELNVRLFAPIASARHLARFDPAQYTGGPEFQAALDNARRRTLRVVMHVHDTLGHRRTLDLVRTMISSPDERSRANAIETLASLPQRRFVIPILPLIERRETAEAGPPGLGQPDPASIEEALSSPDPWLRAAAAVAWHARTGRVPERVQQDPSSIVTKTVRELPLRPVGNCSYRQEVLMSRLAFLHDVRLFADTSLDDLIAVDHVLGLETYLAGEPIVSEGEVGDRLCVVHSGRVEVKRGGHVLRQLGAGDYFGEMALFDDGPRSATVTAIDEVEVLVLQRDRFHSLVRQRPNMLMEVCATLVRRLREAEQEAQPTG
jgi:HEAT repeat protein